MSPEPNIAIYNYEVKGYATVASLFLKITAEPGNNVYSVVLYIKTLQDSAKVSDKKRNENLGRVAEKKAQGPSQDQSCIYCDLYIVRACHDDSQCCRRSPHQGMF